MSTESEGVTVGKDERDAAMPVDWQADGLLWLVNASVFHPRGFSLGLPKVDGGTLGAMIREYAGKADLSEACRTELEAHADQLGGSLAKSWPSPVLQGDGVEAWSYAPDDPPTPDELLARVEAAFVRARGRTVSP